MAEEEPAELAAQLERDADDLARRSQKLGQEAGAVREDWERKRRDASVPGAPEPETSGDDAPEQDETPPW